MSFSQTFDLISVLLNAVSFIRGSDDHDERHQISFDDARRLIDAIPGIESDVACAVAILLLRLKLIAPLGNEVVGESSAESGSFPTFDS